MSPLTTTPETIAVTPVFEIETSPDTAVLVATFEPLPIKILPEVSIANLEKSITAEALISSLTIAPFAMCVDVIPPAAISNPPVPVN